MIFLKLGGSAITDKTSDATARPAVIRRAAREVSHALASASAARSPLALVLGHGSGSFGHFAARKFGFGQRGNWRAYAETGAAAVRLTRIVTDIFLEENVPLVAMQPSASARCRSGALVELSTEPIQTALAHGLVPLVHGDVAFDETLEMTIASTEMVFSYLAPVLGPSAIILAGIVEGVYAGDPLADPAAKLIPEITPANFARIESQLRGSHGVDVTGGMIGKVRSMLAIVQRHPGIRVRIISALTEGLLEEALRNPDLEVGTLIHA